MNERPNGSRQPPRQLHIKRTTPLRPQAEQSSNHTVSFYDSLPNYKVETDRAKTYYKQQSKFETTDNHLSSNPYESTKISKAGGAIDTPMLLTTLLPKQTTGQSITWFNKSSNKNTLHKRTSTSLGSIRYSLDSIESRPKFKQLNCCKTHTSAIRVQSKLSEDYDQTPSYNQMQRRFKQLSTSQKDKLYAIRHVREMRRLGKPIPKDFVQINKDKQFDAKYYSKTRDAHSVPVACKQVSLEQRLSDNDIRSYWEHQFYAQLRQEYLSSEFDTTQAEEKAAAQKHLVEQEQVLPVVDIGGVEQYVEKNYKEFNMAQKHPKTKPGLTRDMLITRLLNKCDSMGDPVFKSIANQADSKMKQYDEFSKFENTYMKKVMKDGKAETLNRNKKQELRRITMRNQILDRRQARISLPMKSQMLMSEVMESDESGCLITSHQQQSPTTPQSPAKPETKIFGKSPSKSQQKGTKSRRISAAINKKLSSHEPSQQDASRYARSQTRLIGQPDQSPYQEINVVGVDNQITLESKVNESEQKRRNYYNREHLLQYDQFKSSLRRKSQMVSEDIKRNYRNLYYLENPDKVQDIEQLMEDNLEHILNQEQLYQKIKFAVDKKTQIKAIKEHASRLTSNLKTKAEKKYDEAYFRQRMLKNSQILMGNKTMYLVRKFAEILISRVRERRDKQLQTANRHHVKKVLKQLTYNETYKMISPTRTRKPLTSIKTLFAINTNSLETGEEQQQNPVPHILSLVKSESQQNMAQIGNQQNEGLVETQLNNLKLKFESAVPSRSLSDGSADIEENSSQPGEYEPSVPTFNQSPKLKQTKTFKSMLQDQKIFGQTFKQLLKMEEVQGKSLEEDSDHQMLKKQKAEGIKNEVISQYIENSLQSFAIPLPILQRIDNRCRFILMNYFLDLGNFQALVDVFPHLVPKNVNKIFLVNNSLKDTTVFNLFENLQYVTGVKQVSILQNELGLLTMSKISNVFLPSQASRTLEKLILKDPQPPRTNRKAADHILTSIKQNSNNLPRLRKLVVSKINLSVDGLMDLAKAIPNLLKFEYLDISSNGLKVHHISQFISALGTNHQLKSLNISYNNLKEKKIASITQAKPKKNSTKTAPQIQYHFIRNLCNFVHFSPFLVHLDISSSNMDFEQVEQFAKYGLRKSRTLQSVHMDNMGFKYEQWAGIRSALNARVSKDREHQQMVILNQSLLRDICPKPKLDSKQVLMLFQNNLKNKDLNGVKQLIQKNSFEVPEDQRICFERNLGKLEMIGSHQWREVTSNGCQICNKSTLCFFVWNFRFSRDRFQHHAFFQHSPIEPIHIRLDKEYNHPFLVTSDLQVHQMVPVQEFLERQTSSYKMARERACDTDVEKNRYKEVELKIKNDISSEEQVEVSYWNFVNQHKNINLGVPKQKKQWWEHIKDELPKGTFMPIDIQQYAQKLTQFYKPDEGEQMLKETYACCVYLIPQSKAEVRTVFVKQKWLDGVDFIGQLAIPREKHMSIYKLEPFQKQIKKQKEIRYFSKPKSVFAKWREDTPKVLSTAFTTDAQFMKCNKFIKEEKDKNDTFDVMLKYYSNLKNQFINQIGSMKSYPVIDWLDFVSHCNDWGIVDKNLTQADIDRIFVATNFEEEDLEDNDDSSLCRYEFSEILIRMAKTKYEEKGICSTVAESFEKLLVEYIIPNTCEIMPWQEFRDQQLWTLEVDDLFKANLVGVDAIYKHFATNGVQIGKRNISKDDAARILEYCQGVDSTIFPVSNESEKYLAAAYSLSKMTLSDEMGEFDKYDKMLHCEFYEFLGRWSYLVFKDRKEPLDVKIQYLLEILLPLVKLKFIPVSIEEDIPSESDYDDDFVQDQLIEKLSISNR